MGFGGTWEGGGYPLVGTFVFGARKFTERSFGGMAPVIISGDVEVFFAVKFFSYNRQELLLQPRHHSIRER